MIECAIPYELNGEVSLNFEPMAVPVSPAWVVLPLVRRATPLRRHLTIGVCLTV